MNRVDYPKAFPTNLKQMIEEWMTSGEYSDGKHAEIFPSKTLPTAFRIKFINGMRFTAKNTRVITDIFPDEPFDLIIEKPFLTVWGTMPTITNPNCDVERLKDFLTSFDVTFQAAYQDVWNVIDNYFNHIPW